MQGKKSISRLFYCNHAGSCQAVITDHQSCQLILVKQKNYIFVPYIFLPVQTMLNLNNRHCAFCSLTPKKPSWFKNQMTMRSNFGIHLWQAKTPIFRENNNHSGCSLTLIFMTTMVVMVDICDPALNVQSHNQLRTK